MVVAVNDHALKFTNCLKTPNIDKNDTYGWEQMLNLQLPSPVQPLSHPIFQEAGVEVWVKRDDLIHPFISGNKWRKLKYNLIAAKQAGLQTLVTFGGAYSNHLLALAAAGHAAGFSTVGIVRGEPPAIMNAIMLKMKEFGMQLFHVSRASFRQKSQELIYECIGLPESEYMFIPEGGANVHALHGVKEIWEELPADFDYICTAMGTGATLAGLCIAQKAKVLGVPVLKQGDLLAHDILRLLREYQMIYDPDFNPDYVDFELQTNYHFGGYAKQPEDLKMFCKSFKNCSGLPIEPVYTGKLMYGLLDLLQKGYFASGSQILVLHTGGVFDIS
jgi:1-aminocyclopropane-1-carboxylate deaminase/D-cysteine desulfhydrase-like pyridoxal-dependent ACC family enzyme